MVTIAGTRKSLNSQFLLPPLLEGANLRVYQIRKVQGLAPKHFVEKYSSNHLLIIGIGVLDQLGMVPDELLQLKPGSYWRFSNLIFDVNTITAQFTHVDEQQ